MKQVFIKKVLPYSIKQRLKYIPGFIPYRFRYSKVFWDTYNFLQESERWSKEKLKEYQMEKLSKLLCHAYDNVTYYRRIFDERGLKPTSIQDFNDLRKIPFLTKDIIRMNKKELKAKNFSESDFIKTTTGGSSGIPLGFYRQAGYSLLRESAFTYNIWERVGFRLGDKKLVLKGRIVRKKNGLEYNPIKKELVCSIFNMDDDHLLAYFKQMKERKIKFIHGHISSVIIFANYLIKNKLSADIHAVLGVSEKVFPFQREIVKKAFNSRLFTFYGQSEQVVLAGECEYSNLYHISPEYGIFELIDENGKNIVRPGQSGEIVGTSFNNYAMPFIRYRIGDIGRYSFRKCKCGREFDLLEDVEGRSYEYVLTQDGMKISLTGLISGLHFQAFERIEKMQIYQEKAGEIEIRIVKSCDYTKRDEMEIKRIIQNAVGNQLSINFEYFKNLPLTEQGKHNFLIQKLPIRLSSP